jgi:hypothetical protein
MKQTLRVILFFHHQNFKIFIPLLLFTSLFAKKNEQKSRGPARRPRERNGSFTYALIASLSSFPFLFRKRERVNIKRATRHKILSLLLLLLKSVTNIFESREDVPEERERVLVAVPVFVASERRWWEWWERWCWWWWEQHGVRGVSLGRTLGETIESFEKLGVSENPF